MRVARRQEDTLHKPVGTNNVRMSFLCAMKRGGAGGYVMERGLL